MPTQFHFAPLTVERWDDFEQLFGANGACGGCWCMFWRLKASEFERAKGEGNRRAMRAIVDSGEVAGLLAYDRDAPVGWVAVSPRNTFGRLGRSRILKPVDEQPVWSVVCFFISKAYRRRGLSVALLEAVCEWVQEQGGKLVEGYPVEPRKDPLPPVFAYTGLAAAFSRAGFEECARRSETRPIMRRVVR